MANTVVQFKRSTANDVPSILSIGEPAYSFKSGKLFVGNTDGTVISIGGKYFVDQSNVIFTVANTAFDTANGAYNTANTGSTTGSAAYDQANTARIHANSAYSTSNGAYGQANTATTIGSNAFGQANTARTHANNAYSTANSAYGQANTATTIGSGAFNQANTARTHANNAYSTANAAYNTANTKFSSSGGTVDGTVTINGDLFVSGNTISTNTSTLKVDDPLIYLASNNYTTDAVDIGFVANYVNATGSNVHTGLYREHITKEYYLFYGYDQEPDNNHIDPNGNNFTVAVLNADIKTSNLNLGGVNAISWLTASYNTANGAYGQANTATTIGSNAFGQANTARIHANNAYNAANAAFTQANTATTIGSNAFGQANTARTHANNAYSTANSAYGQANTATTIGSNAFNQANTARIHANSAYAKANGAVQTGYPTIVANGNTLTASTNTSTLTIIAGTNIGITTNVSNNSIAISDLASGAAFNAANAAFNRANGSSNAANLTSGTISSGRLSGSYTGITGLGTIATGIWQGSTVNVAYGGTGMISFTPNGILYGNAAGSIKVTSAGTDGQVLLASPSGVPIFSMLDGGTF